MGIIKILYILNLTIICVTRLLMLAMQFLFWSLLSLQYLWFGKTTFFILSNDLGQPRQFKKKYYQTWTLKKQPRLPVYTYVCVFLKRHLTSLFKLYKVNIFSAERVVKWDTWGQTNPVLCTLDRWLVGPPRHLRPTSSHLPNQLTKTTWVTLMVLSLLCHQNLSR